MVVGLLFFHELEEVAVELPLHSFDVLALLSVFVQRPLGFCVQLYSFPRSKVKPNARVELALPTFGVSLKTNAVIPLPALYFVHVIQRHKGFLRSLLAIRLDPPFAQSSRGTKSIQQAVHPAPFTTAAIMEHFPSVAGLRSTCHIVKHLSGTSALKSEAVPISVVFVRATPNVVVPVTTYWRFLQDSNLRPSG